MRANANRKTILRGAGVIVLVSAGVLTTAQVLLTLRATRMIQRHVLPRAEEQLGMEIQLGATRVNLFRGQMDLSDLRISNPRGFTPPDVAVVDTAHIELHWLSMLRGTLDVSSLAITNARITLVRNAEGELNRTPRPPQPADGDGDRPAPAPEATRTEAPPPSAADRTHRRASPPSTRLRHLACTMVIAYRDEALADDPVETSFALRLEGNNLRTGRAPDTSWGDLYLRGHLEGDPDAFVTDLHARIAPLTVPERTSFDLSGTIKAIRISDLGSVEREWEVACESAEIAVSILCRDGRFTEGSELTLTLKEPRLTGRLAQRARNLKLPEEWPVHVPLRGRVDDPKVDLETALIQSALSYFSESVGTLLESTTINGKKLDGDLGEAAQKLGEILKNWQ